LSVLILRVARNPLVSLGSIRYTTGVKLKGPYTLKTYMRWLWCLGFSLCLSSCVGWVQKLPFVTHEPTPHGHEYPSLTVSPQRYFLELHIDPKAPTFTGEVQIDAQVERMTDKI